MSADRELDTIERWLSGHKRIAQIGKAIREAIYLVLDGPRTGRYTIEQFEKVEKTFLGLKVEQCIRHGLDLERNTDGLDTRIECT